MSRRTRSVLLGLCSLFAALLVWCDRTGLLDAQKQTPQHSSEIAAYDIQRYHSKTFTVVNVVDGDTIDINAPDGQFDHTRIRLWGVDTPETKSPDYGIMYFGPEAANCTSKLTSGENVTIFLDKDNHTRDKYTRLLAYVKLPDGRFLNEVLLTEGFAYADPRFRHSFYHKYQRLEAAARGQKKGLWEKVTYDQLPKWLQKRKPSLLKNKK